jgi:asparagine synthase (glutamine-hydrolysing)
MKVLRYVAILWDRACDDARITAETLSQRLKESSAKWARVVLNPGLSVLVFESSFAYYRPHLLDNGCGAVLGVLFDRRNPQSNSERPGGFFDSKATEAIVRSGGRHLIEKYWGRYVAFLDDSLENVRTVLRDPIGDIQCYHAQIAGVHLYFSSIRDFLQLGMQRLTVNWEHLRLRVITGDAWADESALNEVECVRPGERVGHNGDRIWREYYWHPFIPARLPWTQEMDGTAAELRSTIRMCTSAWASLHTNALHVLSGGLDSSIVLSCLAATPARERIVCLNFRAVDPDSDERSYARLATDRARCELVEFDRKPRVELERIFDCEPTAGPQHVVMRGLEVQPLITRVASERDATAVFSGDGGDIVFFRGWPELAVVDYARHRGIDGGWVRLAYGAALPSQLSVWHLLSHAVRYGMLRRPWGIWNLVFQNCRLVTEDVMLSARKERNFLNPWNLPIADIPPGKLLHAFGATRPSLFRNPLAAAGPELDFINPLVCQPVVELCLRIPTYLHAAQGNDRAVARAAFASDLPREIVTRVWKGTADRHQQELLSSNLELVREVLLEGGLVKARILDRKRLEKAISPGSIGSVSHSTEVFGYFCAEAWLRRWSNGAAQ